MLLGDWILYEHAPERVLHCIFTDFYTGPGLSSISQQSPVTVGPMPISRVKVGWSLSCFCGKDNLLWWFLDNCPFHFLACPMVSSLISLKMSKPVPSLSLLICITGFILTKKCPYLCTLPCKYTIKERIFKNEFHNAWKKKNMSLFFVLDRLFFKFKTPLSCSSRCFY